MVTDSATIYDSDINVNRCEVSPGSGTFMTNGYCALEQAGLANAWSWWGTDAFLDSINGVANNAGGNGVYWSWFNDLNDGQTALNKHNLIAGEELLLTYNIYPLKITAATTTPLLNSTLTINITQFGYDSSWNPAWIPATGSELVVNGTARTSADGSYQLAVATTAPYAVYARKTGLLNSNTLSINASPYQAAGGGGQIIHHRIDVNQAVGFIASVQLPDGSFGSNIYTDWAAIGLSAFDRQSSTTIKVKSYLQTHTDAAGGLNPISDNARRAMALMSVGLSPYDGTSRNYIQDIVYTYDGKQFGDPKLFNDDIFALLALLKAGYKLTDPMIASDVNFLISRQNASGAWGSIDLTAAAIQALEMLDDTPSVSSALRKARTYLSTKQSTDGSFGNIYTTPWVAQAIVSLGDDPADWMINNYNIDDYLWSKQASDGGLGASTEDPGNRLWATAYALPAALKKPWSTIMTDFPKIVILPPMNIEQATTSPINTTTTTPDQILRPSAPLPVLPATSSPLAVIQPDVTPLPGPAPIRMSDDFYPVRPALQPESPSPSRIRRTGHPSISASSSVPTTDMATATSAQQLAPVPPLSDGQRPDPIVASRKIARTVFYASIGASVLLTLYLGLKFIISMIKK